MTCLRARKYGAALGSRTQTYALGVDLQVSTLVARGALMDWLHSFGRRNGTAALKFVDSFVDTPPDGGVAALRAA